MTEKAPGDPEIVMLAAVTRAAAQDQLFALLRVVQDCASIAKIWEALRIDPETVDTTALTHWLSHEAPRNETPLQSVACEFPEKSSGDGKARLRNKSCQMMIGVTQAEFYRCKTFEIMRRRHFVCHAHTTV
mgnify:CR=1 FL=1